MDHQDSIRRNKAVEDKSLKAAVFDEPVILINLGPNYQPSMSADALYEATKSLLSVDEAQTKKTWLVCAAYQGFIKEVYVVSRWSKAGRWGKYNFEGKVAEDELREKYAGKSVSSYTKRGNQTAVE
jgi:hypothetical protein